MDFDARRKVEWEIGAHERRANEFLAVQTDPAENAARHCAIMTNWFDVLRQNRRIDDEVWWRICSMAREIDLLLERV